jgi:hypothetical protein
VTRKAIDKAAPVMADMFRFRISTAGIRGDMLVTNGGNGRFLSNVNFLAQLPAFSYLIKYHVPRAA